MNYFYCYTNISHLHIDTRHTDNTLTDFKHTNTHTDTTQIRGYYAQKQHAHTHIPITHIPHTLLTRSDSQYLV